MQHLLFLTTNNLPTNPRLLKEIDLAKHTYRVTVVLWQLENWSDAINQKLISERPEVKFILLNAGSQNKLSWLSWALMEKLSRLLYPLFKASLFINALTHTRRAIRLLRAIRNITSPEIIIAHNLGALYPAYIHSQRHNIPFIYDIEDYDPGIVVPEVGKHYKTCTEHLLKQCAPEAKALTSASPLIEEYTLKLFKGHAKHQVILNSFPEAEFIEPGSGDQEIKANTLRMVWFSQTISFGRGLEQLFEALLSISQALPVCLHLTLIGNMDPKFKSEIVKDFQSKIASNTSFSLSQLPPMQQNLLHKELSNHDIGLALEFNTTDFNRQLCLTNKIIAYAQAGLYILATDTPAQKEFISKHTELGLICGQEPNQMADGIKNLALNMNTIRGESGLRYTNSKALTWEKESTKLKDLWLELLSAYES